MIDIVKGVISVEKTKDRSMKIFIIQDKKLRKLQTKIKNYKFLNISVVQIRIFPLFRQRINAYALKCLLDYRFLKLENALIGRIT